ncbi:hypothetical protein EZS27_013089, partial [termite gut metagenome]
ECFLFEVSNSLVNIQCLQEEEYQQDLIEIKRILI